MGEITINLPSDLETSMENLVSQGTYKDKEEVIIALIRAGLIAMRKRDVPKVVPIPDFPPIPPVKPPEKWFNHNEFK